MWRALAMRNWELRCSDCCLWNNSGQRNKVLKTAKQNLRVSGENCQAWKCCLTIPQWYRWIGKFDESAIVVALWILLDLSSGWGVSPSSNEYFKGSLDASISVIIVQGFSESIFTCGWNWPYWGWKRTGASHVASPCQRQGIGLGCLRVWAFWSEWDPTPSRKEHWLIMSVDWHFICCITEKKRFFFLTLKTNGKIITKTYSFTLHAKKKKTNKNNHMGPSISNALS